jgi:phosphate transporter
MCLISKLDFCSLYRYDALKKQIYQLEKQQHGLDRSTYDLESNERTSLMGLAGESSVDAVFIPLLDRELKKVTLFYEQQEKEFLDEVTELEDLVKEQEEAGLAARNLYLDEDDDDDDEDDDEDTQSPTSPSSPRRHRPKSSSFSISRLPSGSVVFVQGCDW